LQGYWLAHLRVLGNSAKESLGLPDNIAELSESVNGYLTKILADDPID